MNTPTKPTTPQPTQPTQTAQTTQPRVNPNAQLEQLASVKPAATTTATATATTVVVGADPTKKTGAMKVNAPFQVRTRTATPDSDSRWLKLLVYGKPGVGKTELCGTAVDVAEMNDVLFIDAEAGDMTLDDSIRIQNAQNIDRIRVTTFKQVARIQEYLKAHCSARDSNNVELLKKLHSQVTGIPVEEIIDPPRYRTVILDSLSEIDAYCLYGLMSFDTAKPVDDDIATAEWKEYRKNNDMMKLLIRAFRDLPIHFLTTCTASYTQDEMKRYNYAPQLTGKLSAQAQGFFDIVGFLIVGAPVEGQEAPRRMFVQPINTGPRFEAKNRRSIYREPFFDNPSMKTIMRGCALIK